MCKNGNISCNCWRDFKNTLSARVFQMSIFKQFFKCSHFYICYSRYSALSKKFRLNSNGWVFAENELSECDAPQKYDFCPQKYVFCSLWNRPLCCRWALESVVAARSCHFSTLCFRSSHLTFRFFSVMANVANSRKIAVYSAPPCSNIVFLHRPPKSDAQTNAYRWVTEKF